MVGRGEKHHTAYTWKFIFAIPANLGGNWKVDEDSLQVIELIHGNGNGNNNSGFQEVNAKNEAGLTALDVLVM